MPRRTLPSLLVSLVLCLFSRSSWAQDTQADVPPTHTVAPYAQLFPKDTVTFTSTGSEALLQREVDGDWVTVCRAPCTAQVERGATYHVDGRGLSTSAELVFPRGPSRAHAETGSLGTRVSGIVLTSVGGATTLVGFMTLGAICNPATAYRCDPASDERIRNTAVAIMGIGAAAVVVGIVMIGMGRTTVDVTRAMRTGAMEF